MEVSEVKLVSWFSEHWYKVDEKFYPSVTTKLGIIRKPFLEEWRGNLGNRECDLRLFEAGQRGTRIHHAWYTLTTGGCVIYNNWRRPTYTAEEIEALKEKYLNNVAVLQHQDEMMDAWKLQKFMEIVKPKVVASELVLYSDKHQEAGTVDNIFEIQEGDYQINGRDGLHLQGGIYVADLKTGNVFSDDTYMQTAAYSAMYAERYGVSVQGTLGLHTNAKTKKGIEGFATYLRTTEEMKEDYRQYRMVSDVWLAKNKTAAPRHLEFPSLLTLKAF